MAIPFDAIPFDAIAAIMSASNCGNEFTFTRRFGSVTA